MKHKLFRTFLESVVFLGIGMVFTACHPDSNLQGYCWSGTIVGIDPLDGEQQNDRISAFFTDESSGYLLSITSYEGEYDNFGYFLPFTYDFDQSDGTITLLYEPSDWKQAQRFRLPFSYDKSAKSISVDLSAARNELELASDAIELKQHDMYKLPSLTGSAWMYEYDEQVDWLDERISYYVRFDSPTKGTLGWMYSEWGSVDEDEAMSWDFDYQYDEGLGKITITVDGRTFHGGFYVRDNDHLEFVVGDENALELQRVVVGPDK